MLRLVEETLSALAEAHGQAWERLAVADLCLSNLITVVKLNNGHCGLALNFDKIDRDVPFALTEKIRGRILERVKDDPLLTDLLFQPEESATFRSLSVALLNALSQSLLTPQHLSIRGATVERGRMPIHHLKGKGSRAVVIGCGGYTTDLCHAPFIEEITVSDHAFAHPSTRAFFEPYLQEVVFPAQEHKTVRLSDGTDNEKLVADCDLLFITGSTLVNGTLPQILEWAGEKPAIVLEGNTAGLYPFPLMTRGVTHLVQTVVDVDFVSLSHRFARQRREGHLEMGDAEYTEIVLPEMRTIERHPSFAIQRSRGSREKKILLLQARNWYDPMIGHEVQCFRERIPDDYELACYNIVSGPWDESVLDGFCAVMVGGSGDYGSAYNDNPWFPPALGFLRRVVERDIPLFCSCWGHQALAVALGGKVEVDEDGYELGILELELTEEGAQDSLFGSLPKRFKAPLGHSEQVTRLPEGARLLASTSRCRVQAYRVKDKPVYSCQFHPELTSSQLWERVDAYIPHLRGQKRESEPASTDNLIADFLATYLG